MSGLELVCVKTVLSTVIDTLVEIAVIFAISDQALDEILTYLLTANTLVSDTRKTMLFPGATVGAFVYALVILFEIETDE